MHFHRFLVLTFLFGMSALVAAGLVRGNPNDGPEKPSAKDPHPPLTLRFLDENGKPVGNTHAGYFVRIRNFKKETGGDWHFVGDVTSDSRGSAVLGSPSSHPFVIARQAERDLVGIAMTKDARPPGVVSITMHAACHVHLRPTSSQLDKIGRKIGYPRSPSHLGPMRSR